MTWLFQPLLPAATQLGHLRTAKADPVVIGPVGSTITLTIGAAAAPWTLGVTAAALQPAGSEVTPNWKRSLPITAAALQPAGSEVTPNSKRSLPITAAALQPAGSEVTPNWKYSLPVVEAVLQPTGQDVTLNTNQSYSLPVTVAALQPTGSEVPLNWIYSLPITPNALNPTGQAIDLYETIFADVTQLPLVTSWGTVSVALTYTLPVTEAALQPAGKPLVGRGISSLLPATFGPAGQNVAITANTGIRLSVDRVALQPSPKVITLSKTGSEFAYADPIVISLVGSEVGLTNLRISVDTASLQPSSQAVLFGQTFILPVTARVIQTNGQDINLGTVPSILLPVIAAMLQPAGKPIIGNALENSYIGLVGIVGASDITFRIQAGVTDTILPVNSTAIGPTGTDIGDAYDQFYDSALPTMVGSAVTFIFGSPPALTMPVTPRVFGITGQTILGKSRLPVTAASLQPVLPAITLTSSAGWQLPVSSAQIGLTPNSLTFEIRLFFDLVKTVIPLAGSTVGLSYSIDQVAIDVAGIMGSARIGNVTIIGDANVFPSGIMATAMLGDVVGSGWSLVNDGQTPGWGSVDDAQSGSWVPVDDSQTNPWTDV